MSLTLIREDIPPPHSIEKGLLGGGETKRAILERLTASPYSSSTCSSTHDSRDGEVSLGTSIMACAFAGGVVLGADSRTTTGSYIANRVSDKLTPVMEPRIWCCRSGSAADTQALADIVRYQLRLLQVNSDQTANLATSGNAEDSAEDGPSVKQAACLFRALGYKYREQLQAGIILAGLDYSSGQGQVWNMPLGGSLHPAPFAIGGSGSAYIYGYCDANYRADFDRQQCERFVLTALALAMSRDGSSGGVVRLVTLEHDMTAREHCRVTRQVFSGSQLPAFYQG